MSGFGPIMQSRRQAMEMSLNILSGRLGGSPGPSFLSKIENGIVTPTRGVALRLAEALQLDGDLVLNATGHSNREQEEQALDALRTALFEEPPAIFQVPVLDVTGEPTGARKALLVRGPALEGYRLTTFTSPDCEPYTGEVLWHAAAKPTEGQGVVYRRKDGALCVGTYHLGTRGSHWIETGRGEKLGAGFTIMGAIRRVTKEMSF